MRSRRGEVPFVAMPVGRSTDPREVLGLARELKTSDAEALGFVMRWEEFVLKVGDSLSGRVKGYSTAHLAAAVGYMGSPRKLVDALKHAGLLSMQRGTFTHPYWRQSITGTYASDRAEQRERWRAQKEAQRQIEGGGQSADVREMSGGHGVDVRMDSGRTADIKKERNGAGVQTPPPAPLGRGEPEGLRRWDWLLAHHERPTNSERCIKYLAAMPADDWELCQWIFGPRGSGPALTSLGKKRAIRADTHKFLASQLYLQFRRERVEKLRHESRPHRVPEAEKQAEAAVQAERAAAGRAFLLALLGDPEVDDAKKRALRAKWTHDNPDDPTPWAAPPEAVPEPLQ